MRPKKVLSLQKSAGTSWSEKAKYRSINRKWLGYSGRIALRIMSAMEDIPNMNQRKLAEIAGVSPQQVNKIVKGKENLTLQTIAKFSDILGVELIEFPAFKYNAGTMHVFIATDNRATLIQFEHREIEFFSLYNNSPLVGNITSNPTAQTIIKI